MGLSRVAGVGRGAGVLSEDGGRTGVGCRVCALRMRRSRSIQTAGGELGGRRS